MIEGILLVVWGLGGGEVLKEDEEVGGKDFKRFWENFCIDICIILIVVVVLFYEYIC